MLSEAEIANTIQNRDMTTERVISWEFSLCILISISISKTSKKAENLLVKKVEVSQEHNDLNHQLLHHLNEW